MTSPRRTDGFETRDGTQVFVGVDLGASTVKANATDASGTVLLDSEVHVTAPKDKGPDEVVESLRAAILEVRAILEIDWRDIALIGLTVPCPCRADGSVSAGSGIQGVALSCRHGRREAPAEPGDFSGA